MNGIPTLLTPAERATLEELIKGGSKAAVAERRGLDEETIRTHTKNIIKKTGAYTIAHATAILIRNGDISCNCPETPEPELEEAASKVLMYISKGVSKKHMGRAMGLSLSTLSIRITQASEALGCRGKGRVALVYRGFETGNLYFYRRNT